MRKKIASLLIKLADKLDPLAPEKRVRPLVGYEPKQMSDGKTYMLATPEKALIDLLYLYPQYSTEEEFRELRLDEDFMQNELDKERLLEYSDRIGSPILTKRIKIMLKTYGI